MSQSAKQNKNCIYPCPAECSETALFVKDAAVLSEVKEQGVEGYDLIYIADVKNKHIFMFGTPNKTCQAISVDLARPVHEAPHLKAAEGEVFSYEWSAAENGGASCVFYSTLLPLRDSSGAVGSILGLVKNITSWAYSARQTGLLKEGIRKTFPQILLMAREEERKSISSALHDEIGSAAVILTSLLSMVKSSVESNDKAQALKDISALDTQIKNSIERVKNIVVSLRPPNLEAVGLEGALKDMAENIAHYAGLEYSFQVEKETEAPVSDEVSIVLFRVAQESLNNMVKHAQAKRAVVYLKIGEQQVTLKISDDGRGFKQPRQRSIKQVGLLSMRDSVAYLGGKFTIKSESGKGTVIEASCPRVVYGVKER